MAANLSASPITDQKWFRQLLEDHGFKPVERGHFTNGRATIRVEGSKLRAVPGDGTKDWIGDIVNAKPDAFRAMLDIILKAPSFASQATIDQAEDRRQTGEAALATIADAIRMHPDTHSGILLRQFVWSIFNGHHVVCLWRLKDVLDSKHNAAVGVVLRSWMDGHLSEDAIRAALVNSGEMDRWDSTHLSSAEQKQLGKALDAVTGLMNSLPPGLPVTPLTRAKGILNQLLDSLREAGKSSKPG